MTRVKEILELWSAHCLAQPETVVRVGGTVRIVVQDQGDSSVVLNLKFPVSISYDSGPSDCVITFSEEAIIAVDEGRLNLQDAFSKGEVQVQGKPEVALKFTLLLASKFNVSELDSLPIVDEEDHVIIQ
jgi:hypothetical protein